MQLVLLCKEQDFKYFGQDLVFGSLIKDLKDLETSGITMPDGKTFKGTVCAIAGDNLGSHCIGGFTENFSKSLHFCRYCEIDRKTFLEDPLAKGQERTENSYQEHVQTQSVGVKFDSLFNELTYFHVCQPGLPPCLGHDLFEGIVSFDLAIYIKHLVMVEKHFTYLDLNRRITQFKYLGSDAGNKPCEVNPGVEKLSGHAVQNWCFLRMLPVLIGDKMVNTVDSEVWQLILQLREIVDLITAPAISTGQVAYLGVLIEEYLDSRRQTFPYHPLKPKHHYILHYPELIFHFGPLIRLWTLRFESKHTYFKRCARKLQNFKNLCGTLAERHQLLQALLGAGPRFPPDVVVERCTEFVLEDHNDNIRQSVAQYNFDPLNTLVTHNVSVKGTEYRSKMFVVIAHNDDGLIVGKIKQALIHKSSCVFFITEQYQAVRLPEFGVYYITRLKTEYCCVAHENYYPLTEYTVWGMSLLILHHSIPTF